MKAPTIPASAGSPRTGWRVARSGRQVQPVQQGPSRGEGLAVATRSRVQDRTCLPDVSRSSQPQFPPGGNRSAGVPPPAPDEDPVEDPDLSGGGTDQVEQDPDRGGLPAPLWPQETRPRPLAHGQIQPVRAVTRPKCVHQPPDRDHHGIVGGGVSAGFLSGGRGHGQEPTPDRSHVVGNAAPGPAPTPTGRMSTGGAWARAGLPGGIRPGSRGCPGSVGPGAPHGA
jgi:hypothetical protein